MTKEDRPRFALALTAMAEVYAESLSSQRMEMYFAALSVYSIENIERAITQCIRLSRFFPKPAELIDQLTPALAKCALLGWHTALAARNPHISVRFEDLLINKVVKRMGGWPEFCNIETSSLPFKQKEFERLYMALAALPTFECCEYLPGEHEKTHPGEFGFIPVGGMEYVDGKAVRNIVRLEEPKLITDLASQRALSSGSSRELDDAKPESTKDE